MPNKPTGNALIGQGGGPTAVINQTLVGVIEEVQRYPHIRHLLGAKHGVRGIVNDDFIDLRRQPREMLELVAATPGAALGSTRDLPDQAYCERIFESFRKHDVRYFFYIGGNDSAEVAHVLNQVAHDAKYDLLVIHLPKTIDNDLLANDHCPGYGSAARFVAMAFIGDNQDNRALPGIKINVLMGRGAGFLTAASILARQREDDGPHLVYVPETPFNLDQFLQDVAAVLDKYGRCVVAVSEGICNEHNIEWSEIIRQKLGRPPSETDPFHHVILSTGLLADYLADNVKQNLGKRAARVRADTYGYLQRSFPGIYSQVDAWEARLVGQMGVSYSVDTQRSGSVALVRLPATTYAVGTRLVPLEAVAPPTPPKFKTLERKYLTPHRNNIDDSFREYVRPLVGDLPKVGWFEQIAIPPLGS
jgi:6-phosphofructokinase